MSFAALAAAVVIGVGTTVASNAVQGAALSKSAQIKAKAYDQLQPLDVDELNSISTKAELGRYSASLQAQRDLDPSFAQARQLGSGNIVSALRADSRPGAADKAASEIGSSLESGKADNDALITSLIDKAKEDLAAGATLPPEFQAELIRSGLENAGVNGTEVSGRGVSGSNIRRLLGSEGLALKERREGNARTNISAAEMLKNSRQSALTNFAELTNNLIGGKFQRANAGAAFAQSVMPNIGLSGADAANIAVQNSQLKNQKILAQAGIQSDTAIRQAALTSNSIGAAGAGATTALGTPGAGSWIGGLFSTGRSGRSTGDVLNEAKW